MAIGLTALLALWIGREDLWKLLTLLGDRETVIAYLYQFGFWGPFLLVAILGLQVVIFVIPGHVLMVASGYLYGFGGGLILNLLATVGFGQFIFMLTRQVGRLFVQRLVPDRLLKRIDQIPERQEFTFFLLLLWFPIVPSNLMNYIAGLGSISFWRFLVVNFLGRLPGVALTTLIGSHGLQLSTRDWVGLIILGIILYFAGRYGTAKIEGHYFSQDDSQQTGGDFANVGPPHSQ